MTELENIALDTLRQAPILVVLYIVWRMEVKPMMQRHEERLDSLERQLVRLASVLTSISVRVGLPTDN